MLLIYVPIRVEAVDRRNLLRRTILDESVYTKLVVRHIFVVGFTSNSTLQKQLEVENSTHLDTWHIHYFSGD